VTLKLLDGYVFQIFLARILNRQYSAKPALEVVRPILN
jgi:hypothetical protein